MKIKRVISSAVLMLLSLAMAATAVSCNGSKDTGSKSSKKGEIENPYIDAGQSISKEVMEALQNSGDVMWYSGVEEKTDYDKQFIEYFKKYYGGNFSYKFCSYGDDMSQFLVDFANNDAPDMVGLNYRYWPKAGNRQLVYSVDELKEKGVVGLDHPALTQFEDVAKRTFSIDGKTYAFSIGYNTPVMIGVNLDLFDQYKVKSPVEYYKEGTWDFKTFMETCKNISRATSDGSQIYGYSGWDHNWFITANDCDLVIWDNGKLKSNLKDKNIAPVLQNIQDLSVNKYFGGDFKSGTTAMNAATADNLGKYLKDVTFKWDVVPFPYGENNTSGNVPGEVTGRAVSTSSKNLQGTVNSSIARYMFDKFYLQIDGRSPVYTPGAYGSSYTVYSEDQMKLIETSTLQCRQAMLMGVGTLSKAQVNFFNALRNGNSSVKEVIDTYAPMFEGQCEAEMENAKR